MLCYVMLCYVRLCYVMLCYVIGYQLKSDKLVSPLNVTLFDFFLPCFLSCTAYTYNFYVFYSGSYTFFYDYGDYFYFGFYLNIDADIESFNIDFFGFLSNILLIYYFIIAKCSSESYVPATSIISKLPNFTLLLFTFFVYCSMGFSDYSDLTF
jgi:hypothetical protein